eukprot:gene9382-14548_t
MPGAAQHAAVLVACWVTFASPAAGHSCLHDNVHDCNDNKRLAKLLEERVEEKTKQMSGDEAGLKMAVYFDEESRCSDGKCYCEKVGQAVVASRGGVTHCAEEDILTDAMRKRMEEIISKAVNWIRRALRIKRRPANLSIKTANCNQVQIPTCMRKFGLGEVDFAVFVSALPMDEFASNTVAWALPCQEDTQGRPVAGHINIVPSAITSTTGRPGEDNRSMHNSVMIVVHELFHALGFSANYWADSNNGGKPRPGWFKGINPDQVTKTINGTTYIVTPRVKEEVRRHFYSANDGACPEDLPGMAIEQDGGTGSKGSHWEKRLMGYEAMTATVSDDSVIVMSNITLAYFEDSGFYDPNYEITQRAPAFDWSDGTCLQQLKQCVGPDYCTDDEASVGDHQCSPDHNSLSRCVPESYSGCNVRANIGYCSSVLPVRDCTKFSNDSDLCTLGCSYDEKTGVCSFSAPLQSKCFNSDIYIPSWPVISPVRCYAVTNCSKNGYTILIDYGKIEVVTCTREQEGQRFRPEGSGWVECAPVDLVCADAKWMGEDLLSKDAKNLPSPFTSSPLQSDQCQLVIPQTVNGCECQGVWEVKSKPSHRCNDYCCSFEGEAPWCFVENQACEGA